MLQLAGNEALTPEQSVILAIDKSNYSEAERLVRVAKEAGASLVKVGLEFSSRFGWRGASSLAEDFGIEWIADAKIYDIPNTTAQTVDNISRLAYPPSGITISTGSGVKSMRSAQHIVEDRGVTMLGVTHLTSVDAQETEKYDHRKPNEVVWEEALRAVEAGIGGVVCSAEEVYMVSNLAQTRHLFSMIPGTRSEGAQRHDQKRSRTPGEAVADGADLLVIGRQVTKAENPAYELKQVVAEIAEARGE